MKSIIHIIVYLIIFSNYLFANKDLYFEENKGQVTDAQHQANEEVLYRLHTSEVNFYITDYGLTWILYETREKEDSKTTANANKHIHETNTDDIEIYWNRVNMKLLNADIKKYNISTFQPSESINNYYLGHHPEGIVNVKSFAKIKIASVYPGIDWVIYSENSKIKYEFVVHPNADPSLIKWTYEGADNSAATTDGSIVLECKLGKVEELKPYIYQHTQSSKKEIGSSYIQSNKVWRYNIASYDKGQQLVIDPELSWGTYFGKETGGSFSDVKYYEQEDALYIVGRSSDFFIESSEGNTFQGVHAGGGDIVVMKLHDEGGIMWSTYYGGSALEFVYSCAVDSGGNVYVVGETESNNFPVAAHSGSWYQDTRNDWRDGVIFKLGSTGLRDWASYFGGSGFVFDRIDCIEIDKTTNDVIFSGYTTSDDLLDSIISPSSYKSTTGASDNLFIVKIQPDGTSIWGTYFGTNSGGETLRGSAIDGFGNTFFIAYADAAGIPLVAETPQSFQKSYTLDNESYLFKFSPDGELLWSTYFGDNVDDRGIDISIGNCNEVFVIGEIEQTTTNFPLLATGNAYYQDQVLGPTNLYVGKFSNTGEQLWTTFLGGTGTLYLSNEWRVEAAPNGNTYIVGGVQGGDFPVKYKPNDWRVETRSGPTDVVCVQFDAENKLRWSTFMGSPMGFGDFGTGITFNEDNEVFFIGAWARAGSNALQDPGGTAYYQATTGATGDAFLVKFSPICPSITYSSPCLCRKDSIAAEINNATSINWNTSGLTNPIEYYPNEDTTIIAYVSNALCTDTIIIPITVYLEDANVNGDTIVCQGDSVALSASAMEGEFFVWSNGDSGLTSTYFPSFDDSMVISIFPFYANCNTQLPFKLLEQDTIGTVSNDTSVCFGEEPLILLASGGDEYEWGSSNTDSVEEVFVLTDTVYSVVITDTTTGCADTQFVNISIIESNMISIEGDSIACIGDTISLTAIGTDNHTWSTGSNSSTIQIVFSGNTTVTVTTEDSSGCIDSSAFSLLEDETGMCEKIDTTTMLDIFIPNVFALNGTNSLFSALVKGSYQSFNMIIYDRYGNEIFYSNNPSEKWDASNGETQQIYIYNVTLNGTERYVGNVLLLD